MIEKARAEVYGKKRRKAVDLIMLLKNIYQSHLRSLNHNKVSLPGDFLNILYKTNWVVYLPAGARQPFAEAEQVIKYLGRYTHRIVISNHRIKSIDACLPDRQNNTVTSHTKTTGRAECRK